MRREQAFELNHSSEPLLKKNSALNVLPFGVCDVNTAIEMTKKEAALACESRGDRREGRGMGRTIDS
jgi:hypothetical protein